MHFHDIKRAWTEIEDEILRSLINMNGPSDWSIIAESFPRRTAKQCRERWHNYLDPNINDKHSWTLEEDQKLIEVHNQYGNHWSKISKFFRGISDSSIRNRFKLMMRAAAKKAKKNNKMLCKISFEDLRNKQEESGTLPYFNKMHSSVVSDTSSLCDQFIVQEDDSAKDVFTHFINEVNATSRNKNMLNHNNATFAPRLISDSMQMGQSSGAHSSQIFPLATENVDRQNPYKTHLAQEPINPAQLVVEHVPMESEDCFQQSDLDYIYFGLELWDVNAENIDSGSRAVSASCDMDVGDA